MEPVDYKDQRFFLNEESEEMLDKLHPSLAACVRQAAAISDIEVQVVEGLRSESKHTELYRKGATQHPNQSTHFYGVAVDLVLIVEGKILLEQEPYDDLAECMKIAAIENSVKMRWGAAWQWEDIRTYEGFMEDLTNQYLESCLKENRRPNVCFHHFEIAIA